MGESKKVVRPDEEFSYTAGRCRDLFACELRRRQDARYRSWDVVRRDNGSLYLITGAVDPVETAREDGTGEHRASLYPNGCKSYAEYFSKLRGYQERYRASDPDLAEAFDTVIGLVKAANHKEWWSVVRYVGPAKVGPSGLTPQRCYYWPCSPQHPEYEGVVDDEESTSYLYPCDAARWEVVDDPTGMAARALAGEEDVNEIIRQLRAEKRVG